MNARAPVLLVGAGAAGVGAALWLHDFEVPFDWLDRRGEIGGILRRVHNGIDNYPCRRFEDGNDLIAELRSHTQVLELAPRRATLDRVDLSGSNLTAIEAGGECQQPSALILATGTRYKTLGIPGESQGMGDYVSQSAMADAHRFAGRKVAVVGGGDSGFENALVLADQGCTVVMLLRNDNFRARPSFITAVREHDRITIAPIPSEVRCIDPIVDGCRLEIEQRGETMHLEVACLFVRIGVEPILPSGCHNLDVDKEGYLVVNDLGQSSHPAVYAAGDVISTPLRSVATAVSSGALAARGAAILLGQLPDLH